MRFFLTLCAAFAVVENTKLPPNFKKCNRSKPNFKTCLLEAAQYGITQFNRPYKEFKTISLDPLFFPLIEVTAGTPLTNVTSILSNCTFYGLLDTKFDNINFDFEKKSIHVDGVWPKFGSHYGYQINGSLMGVPIKGEGSDGSMILTNFKWIFDLAYDEVKKRGKTYVKPVSGKFDGEPETLHMNMDELFGGNKESSGQVNKIINDNWKEIYSSLRERYTKIATETLLKITNGWFSKLSLEEAFDD